VKISMYTMSVEAFVPTLNALTKILDKAAEHATAKKFEPSVLVNARLAPDMFPLSRQVQIACDFAKNSTGRLIGQDPPRFEDNEQTLDQLRARVAKTLDYLQGVRAAAFEGSEDREITIPIPTGGSFKMNGLAHLKDWALPNFYFHAVTAYAILRHNGVDVGKRDFLSELHRYMQPG
jgi:uncharacterized protein